MTKSNEENDIKRKVISVATAASLLTGGLFTTGGSVPEPNQDRIAPPPAIELVLPDLIDDDPDDEIAVPEEEKKRKGRFASKKLAVRAAMGLGALLLVWLIGAALTFAFIQVLNPVMASVLGWLITAVLCAVTYFVVFKTVLPETPLKKIFDWKALLFVVVATAALRLALKFTVK